MLTLALAAGTPSLNVTLTRRSSARPSGSSATISHATCSGGTPLSMETTSSSR